MVRKSIWNDSERHNRRRIRITLYTSSKITNNHYKSLQWNKTNTRRKKIMGNNGNKCGAYNMSEKEALFWKTFLENNKRPKNPKD